MESMEQDRQQPDAHMQEPKDETFARLWSHAQPRVARYIRSVVPDFQEAEDILQETAVTCVRKMEVYDPSRSFEAWAKGIARNEVFRSRRRSQKRPSLLDFPDIAETIDETHDQLRDELDARTRALEKCIATLSEKTRQLLEFRYTHNFSMEAIASRTLLQANSIKVMLSRTRFALRGCIEKNLALEARQ
jgi:RNA polymerase sigma-70 factor, ECF subfamily